MNYLLKDQSHFHNNISSINKHFIFIIMNLLQSFLYIILKNISQLIILMNRYRIVKLFIIDKFIQKLFCRLINRLVLRLVGARIGSSSSIRQSSSSQNKSYNYLAALENVDILTPLIFPYNNSSYLMEFGSTYVSFVVDLYLISGGNSIPFGQFPL